MDYLNTLHVDHIVMETRNRPLNELEVFKDLRGEIGRVQHKRVALFKLLNTNHPKHRLRTYL